MQYTLSVACMLTPEAHQAMEFLWVLLVSMNVAICDMIECENGGTCSAPDECSCTAGWSGDTCAQGKCHCVHVV